MDSSGNPLDSSGNVIPDSVRTEVTGYFVTLSVAQDLSGSIPNSVTASGTGQHQVFGLDNGQLYLSNDYGNSWVISSSQNSYWTSIAISSTGQYLYAISSNAAKTSSVLKKSVLTNNLVYVLPSMNKPYIDNLTDTKIQELVDSAPSQIITLAKIDQLTEQLAGLAPLVNPTFTGNVIVPTPAVGNDSTTAASTAFVQAALTFKAPLVNPTFTGIVTVPTPAVGDNTTTAASTAFVQAAVQGITAPSNNGTIQQWTP